MKYQAIENNTFKAFYFDSMLRVNELKDFLQKERAKINNVETHSKRVDINTRSDEFDTWIYTVYPKHYVLVYANGFVATMNATRFNALYISVLAKQEQEKNKILHTSGEISKTFKLGDIIVVTDIIPVESGFNVQSRTLLYSEVSNSKELFSARIEFNTLKPAITYLRGYSIKDAEDFIEGIENHLEK